MGYYEDKRKRKFALIGVSSLVLVAMVVGVAVTTVRMSHDSDSKEGDSGDGNMKASMKAIEAICQPTQFKKTCVQSLSANAGNSTDPKDLVQVAFKVAMKYINDAAKHSVTLQKLENDPRGKLALKSCKELMGSAVQDLQESFNKLGEFDLSKVDDLLEDLKIWLSASITYQETCLDGFENVTGDAGESMRHALKTAGELTRNGLAIVSEMSSFLADLNIPTFNRRLLSTGMDGFPSWLGQGKRRLLAEPAMAKIKADAVVAQDGSGQYKTINEALQVVPKNSTKLFVIYIKAGVYKEYVDVKAKMKNVMFIGDGPTKTKISGDKNFVDGIPTFRTPTVAVVGEGFIARDIGIENTAGAKKHQAVALRVQSQNSVFYNCQFDGYQDTLYAHTMRQFYRDCTISGTIDFVFGNAAVVFQNCTMVVRKPLENQQNIVTAQGRKDRKEPTGIILQGCTIKADPEYYPVRNKLKSYLGRPWKEYSRTIIMESTIDDLIQPEGWLPWMGDFALRTCFYSEFNNVGAGSDMSKRVKWKGVKNMTSEHALKFTVRRFIRGDSWIKASGVPYVSGMMK
ncbi:hypothetical protein Scep_030738 [Stephania cephalantha]|uniref:Pectinesterase n=1 Tax=Stephania cephalantha TaxID=152367 RepID=A0AAP0HGS0_9MAGN